MYKTSFHSIKNIEGVPQLTVEMDGALMTFNVLFYMDRIWGYKQYRKTFMKKLNEALEGKHFWVRNDLTPDERSFMEVLISAGWIPY